jgi:hypothetical protein
MKKFSGIILSILLAVFTTSALKAQDMALGLGVKAGATYSQFYTGQSGLYHYNDAIGYTGGIFVPVSIMEGLSVQPEVLLSYRPFVASYYQDAKRYTLNTAYYFIDIPLLAQYQVLDFIKVELGASASYLLHGSNPRIEDETGLTQNPENLTHLNTVSTLAKPMDWNFAAVGGASYLFDFGLEVGARVAYQFTKAYEYNRISENVKPITYQVLVSYKLPFIDIQF